MRREVEDVPELIQHIQSLLPVTEAAHTSLVSKSWLHAWSTNPTLRFCVRKQEYGKSMKLADVEHTLTSYLHNNLPIERFDLIIDIENHESASHAKKWIGSVATKASLKEFALSLSLWADSFTLPDEILSGENLTKIRVIGSKGTASVCMTPSPVTIKCLFLQKLYLDSVCISEQALHDILSSCRLLVKIELLNSCKGFKTIKVKNLPRLYELKISLEDEGYGDSPALEISHVPTLGVFSYNVVQVWQPEVPPIPYNGHSISLGSSVTRLMLGCVVPDNACLDMVRSGFPFLESLTLDLTTWMSESFDFTSASIKRLSLLSCPHSLSNLQVHAPKLLSFQFSGYAMPSLLFPVSSLKQITASLDLKHHQVDASFFLKMREALRLPHKCCLRITTNNNLPLNINIDDLRSRLLFPPATNVQQLSFETRQDKCLWERSTFFDAFFEICHPKQVFAQADVCFKNNNHFCRLMLREVLEKNRFGTAYWPHHLKHVHIRKYRCQKWKTLTNAHRRLLDGSAPDVDMYFHLKWC